MHRLGVVTDPEISGRLKTESDIPWTGTVIYETHIKGLSNQNPDVPPSLRGTYLGAASDAVLAHLKHLGRDNH